MGTRKAAFAGSWYPSDPRQCRAQIESFFSQAPAPPPDAVEGLGGIVPHAGWVYSGRIAGSVVALLKSTAKPDVVVLFGGHLGPSSSHRVMVEGSWETPLGDVEVASDLARALLREFPAREESGRSAQPDNTLELQLPFVRHAFPGAKVLPLAVAPTQQGIAMGRRLGKLVREKGIAAVVMGSTDLTHYGPGYGFTPMGPAPKGESWVRESLDRSVIQRMLEMDPWGIIQEALDRGNACCPGAAAAAVECLKQLGAKKAQLVCYATSREVAPSEDFVGYAGIVYWG